MTAPRRYLPIATLLIAILTLYLSHLDAVGMVGPDEPRYAAIGRAMARTGDLVTPRLWGVPWFEKPPLLYWMTALGNALGLNADLAGRIPVVLLSLAFLLFYYRILSREFGVEAALISTSLLSTSAGWLAFSGIGITDLPLAAFFSAVPLLALRLLRVPHSLAPAIRNRRIVGMGLCLGFAILAKGLVPIALAVSLLWFLRAYWRQSWILAASAAVVAAPWYVAVYLQNGNTFIQEFFIKHHLERLYSTSLQHVQPWYYYLPVLLAAVFPWTPLFLLLLSRHRIWDQRRRLLLAVPLFGFAFFTISLNKLPGYLLPLLPSAFALLGSVFQQKLFSQIGRIWLLAAALCIALIPMLTTLLPGLLAGDSVSTTIWHSFTKTTWFYILLPLAVAILARRAWAGILLVLCVVLGGILLKAKAYPVMDRQFSTRGFWRTLALPAAYYCDGGLHRNWQYGLAYYFEKPLPPCAGQPGVTALRQAANEPPQMVPLP